MTRSQSIQEKCIVQNIIWLYEIKNNNGIIVEFTKRKRVDPCIRLFTRENYVTKTSHHVTHTTSHHFTPLHITHTQKNFQNMMINRCFEGEMGRLSQGMDEPPVESRNYPRSGHDVQPMMEKTYSPPDRSSGVGRGMYEPDYERKMTSKKVAVDYNRCPSFCCRTSR